MAINVDKAFENENGYSITDSTGNEVFYITSGSGDPSGVAAPVNSWYFRTDTQTIYYKFDAGNNDWRQIRANDITSVASAGTPPGTDIEARLNAIAAQYVPFDNTGLRFNATDTKDALVELRNETVLSIDALTSTLNGNHTILVDDSKIHTINGTATGYSITLPDATALFVGRRFEVVNESPEEVELKDNDGTVLLTLIPGDSVTATLETNIAAAGDWLLNTITSAATGITSSTLTSNTNFSTTSATDTIITGFTITPSTGRYAVFFSADSVISQNNRLAEYVVFVDGVAVENTRRIVQGLGSNYEAAQNTVGEINVNGSQTVDVRVNVTSGTLDINQRSLVLIRLGA